MRYQAALRPDSASIIKRGAVSPDAAHCPNRVTAAVPLGRPWPSRVPGSRYNETFMDGLLYAAIAYIRSPVGIFVEELRRELHPAHTHADAHITMLPPRALHGSERQAMHLIAAVCHETTGFEITLGDVESFVPVTPTVFLRVARGAYRMRELHDRMNHGVLQCVETWPYMPHLTILKADDDTEARKTLKLSRRRWAGYSDTRHVRIKSLTLVKGSGERWVDVATWPLGDAAIR